MFRSEEVSVADDILLNKAASIERYICRVREEYAKDPAGFAQNYTHQNAAILNIQRACEAALAMGIPQSSRDVGY